MEIQENEERVTRIDFSLDDFEHWVGDKNYEQAELGLRAILDHLRQEYPLYGARINRPGSGKVLVAPPLKPFDDTPDFVERMGLYRRLADAVSDLFSDKSYRISDRAIKDYLVFKNYLRELYVAAGYVSMDSVLVRLGLLEQGSGLKLSGNPADFIRFLICYTLDSGVNVDFRLFFRFNPMVATWAYIGMLTSCHRVIDRRAEEVRDYFLGIHDVLEQAELDDDLVQTLPNPWMLCTYADRDDRHELKRSLNLAAERWLDKKLAPGVKKRAQRNVNSSGDTRNGKPVVVVCAEVLRHSHAMFRCYAETFNALRKSYYTVLVADPNAYDEISAQCFDEVVEVSVAVKNIDETAKSILKQKPHIIYYPSLGMAAWTVALCNIRLARVQVMTGGHPASSMSRHIDYFVAGFATNEKILEQKLFTEKLLLITGEDAESYAPHPDLPDELPDDRKHDGVVRIAVNSSLMKISPRFVEVCQILTAQSSVKLEFHFFIVERGIRVDSTRISMHQLLPNSRVYPQFAYKEYLTVLSQCDLALGTFPFGGTNTNVDLALLGIPKILMLEGTDLSGQTDILYWRRFDIDRMFYAENELNYLANAIVLIHNDKMRKEQSERLRSDENRSKVFEYFLPNDEPVHDIEVYDDVAGTFAYIEDNYPSTADSLVN